MVAVFVNDLNVHQERVRVQEGEIEVGLFYRLRYSLLKLGEPGLYVRHTLRESGVEACGVCERVVVGLRSGTQVQGMGRDSMLKVEPIVL